MFPPINFNNNTHQYRYVVSRIHVVYDYYIWTFAKSQYIIIILRMNVVDNLTKEKLTVVITISLIGVGFSAIFHRG